MKPITFVFKMPRVKRRAVELFDRDLPFRGRSEPSRVNYTRKVKHRDRAFDYKD